MTNPEAKRVTACLTKRGFTFLHISRYSDQPRGSGYRVDGTDPKSGISIHFDSIYTFLEKKEGWDFDAKYRA